MSEILCLKEIIDAADKVLIGIGPEFEAGMAVLENTEIYKCFQEKLESEKPEADYDWMYPLMLMHSLSDIDTAVDLKSAYSKLHELVQNKDYFVLNMNMDSLAEMAGFDLEKMVSPCGTYNKLQCDERCEMSLYKAEPYINGVCSQLRKKDIRISDILQEKCDCCQGKVVPNTVNASKYNELGYARQWDNYQRWLMGTVNRNLVILELGTGIAYSEIIRTPFEKMVTYNKKSKLIRVGTGFPFLPEKLENRGFIIKENSVSYINNIQL